MQVLAMTLVGRLNDFCHKMVTDLCKLLNKANGIEIEASGLLKQTSSTDNFRSSLISFISKKHLYSYNN